MDDPDVACTFIFFAPVDSEVWRSSFDAVNTVLDIRRATVKSDAGAFLLNLNAVVAGVLPLNAPARLTSTPS